MSLLNTLNPNINNSLFYEVVFHKINEINFIANLDQYITWNEESYNVMYNIILLTLSCFTWCYFITFMSIKFSLKTKMFDDLIINVISLFAGYFGILIFGYYNIVFSNVIFVIGIMVGLNLQLFFGNNFNMVEYAVINSILTTFINVSIVLLLLYKMPCNIVINFNINTGDEPVFKIL